MRNRISGSGERRHYAWEKIREPAGSPDTTFDGDGTVTVRVPEFPEATATAVALAPGGNIIVAGAAERILTRFLPSGAVDASFATMGVARWPESCVAQFGCSGAASVLVVPPSHPGGGRLIVAGWKSVNSDQHLAAVAFEYETGRLDRRFGNWGSVVPGPEVSRAKAAALTPDGKLLVAGRGYEEEILLYRYHLQ